VDPDFNKNISIDGDLEDWKNIGSESLELKTNSDSNSGLPIEFKCAQDKDNLYLAISYEWEGGYVGKSEFLGVLISPSQDVTNLTDARIINMSYSHEDSTYTDYYINNYNFTRDSLQNGDGIGRNDSISGSKNQLAYEFSIPLNEGNEEDVALEYGSTYAFNISQGNDPTYPQGIVRSNSSVLVSIKDPSSGGSTGEDFSEVGSFIAAIIIFIIVGISYGYYVFKIFLLKDKMERIKR
jgi:hypothetical protein